jgi:hypothetical protein
MISPKCARIILATSALVGGCLVLPAHGQLRVVSMLPADGATAVDTAATLEIIFSAPLDTAARFVRPKDFFLGLLFNPETPIDEVDSITISQDLRSVSLHNLHLQARTRHTFTVFAARSITGESLQQPATVTITTADELPTASLSGRIDSPGGDATGTLVLMYHVPFGGLPEGVGVVSSPDGGYQINHIPGGTYWPVAINDVNKNGSFDPEIDIDVVGVYDLGRDGFPDSLVVTPGRAFTGIDVNLFLHRGITVHQRIKEAQAMSKRWAVDARLVKAVTPMLANASVSGHWIYLFHSPARAGYFGVIATSAFIWHAPMECDADGCRFRHTDFAQTASNMFRISR